MWFPRLSIFEKADLAKSTECAASGVCSLFHSVQYALVYELKIKGNLTCVLLCLYNRSGREEGRDCVCLAWSPGSKTRWGDGRWDGWSHPAPAPASCSDPCKSLSWSVPPLYQLQNECHGAYLGYWCVLCHSLWVSEWWWHHYGPGHLTGYRCDSPFSGKSACGPLSHFEMQLILGNT